VASRVLLSHRNNSIKAPLVDWFKLILGVSLCCSALLSHKYLSVKERAEVGITDNLIRLSVGIEDAADIMKDIDQALLLAFK
jgi:hypothetical protein